MEEQSVNEETAPLKAEMFPKLSVEYPDGTVYESGDGGKNWIKDREVQTPSVYATFEGDYPVRMSENAVIAVGNKVSSSLYTVKEEPLLREENGEWIDAELLDKEMFSADISFRIRENEEVFL